MSILIPETCDSVRLYGKKKKKRIKNTDRIEVANHLTSRWEDYLGLMDYLCRCNVIAKVLVKDRDRTRVKERLKDAAGFEDGGRRHEPRNDGGSKS